MERSHRILVVAVACFLALYFAWEWYLSPQARVERFLHGLAEAVEKKDSDRLLASLSTDYSDYRGLDREGLADLIERGFERVDRLNVTLETLRSEVEGDQASTSFDLTVVAVRGEERFLLVGQPMQGEKLRVELRKESGDWKIVTVSHTEREY